MVSSVDLSHKSYVFTGAESQAALPSRTEITINGVSVKKSIEQGYSEALPDQLDVIENPQTPSTVEDNQAKEEQKDLTRIGNGEITTSRKDVFFDDVKIELGDGKYIRAFQNSLIERSEFEILIEQFVPPFSDEEKQLYLDNFDNISGFDNNALTSWSDVFKMMGGTRGEILHRDDVTFSVFLGTYIQNGDPPKTEAGRFTLAFDDKSFIMVNPREKISKEDFLSLLDRYEATASSQDNKQNIADMRVELEYIFDNLADIEENETGNRSGVSWVNIFTILGGREGHNLLFADQVEAGRINTLSAGEITLMFPEDGLNDEASEKIQQYIDTSTPYEAMLIIDEFSDDLGSGGSGEDILTILKELDELSKEDEMSSSRDHIFFAAMASALEAALEEPDEIEPLINGIKEFHDNYVMDVNRSDGLNEKQNFTRLFLAALSLNGEDYTRYMSKSAKYRSNRSYIFQGNLHKLLTAQDSFGADNLEGFWRDEDGPTNFISMI